MPIDGSCSLDAFRLLANLFDDGTNRCDRPETLPHNEEMKAPGLQYGVHLHAWVTFLHVDHLAVGIDQFGETFSDLVDCLSFRWGLHV